jgi:cell division septal protein FtsQ
MAASDKKYIKNCTGDSREKSSAISKKISRAIFYALFLLFIATSVYILIFSQYLQITDIKITGNQELSNWELSDKVHAFLNGKFLKILPKNNFLLVSESRMENMLENNFKKIRSVSAVKKFPNSIAINIEERKAMLVWCSGENCFLVDENGNVYNTADFNSQEILQNNLIQINDQSGQSVLIGNKVVDFSYGQYVLGIKNALKNIGQEVSDEVYETPSNMADEIDVKTAQGTKIYFSTQFPLESAVHTLEIVLKKEIPEDKQKNLDYIDLRSEGKVFYKFKEEDSENEEK